MHCYAFIRDLLLLIFLDLWLFLVFVMCLHYPTCIKCKTFSYNLNIILDRIGQETLMDENLADEKIEIELAPVAVQLAYVQQVTTSI